MDAIDYLNPTYVAVPDRLPMAARLEFWLSNPLLATTPRRLAATREASRLCLFDTEREALLYRLKDECASRRASAATFCSHGHSHHGMKQQLEHPLLNTMERSQLHRFFRKLACAEWPWLYGFLQQVLARREEHSWQHSQNVA